MHLTHLALQGFKTFATRTEFAFIPGITAIVGPNGSGKSNIADAVRWVLGEQSLRPLRIKRTEDVIFAGSSSRARQGLAEVSLTLDNSDGRLPIEFGEVTITRRAYRSGEGEYRINNNKVRLRDVLELLGEGQIGQSTYTVIGQGMIDEVLSLRPEERRSLFEEAAGIGLYQRKRREAANRLSATESNILRVNDILNELGPRLQRLQRQAQRAQEHAALVGELLELLTLWYGHRWEQSRNDLLLAEAQVDEARSRLRAGRKHLSALEQRAGELRQQQITLRESLEGWHRQSSALHAQAEAQQRDLVVWAERRAALHRQRESVLGEVPSLVATREDEERRTAEAETDVTRLVAERADLQARLTAIEQRWSQRQRRRADLEEELTQAQDAATRCATTLAQARNQLAQIGARREELRAEIQEHQRTIAQVHTDDQVHRDRMTVLTAEMAELARRVQTLADEQASREAQATQAAAHGEILVTQIQALERERHGLAERLALLADLRDSHEGYRGGVRFVLQAAAGGRLPGIVGTVTSLLVVPPELETAIEAALESRLQDLVVETWADAVRAIEELKGQRAGRATFLPLDTLRPTVPDAGLDLPGVLGRASELVSHDARYANVFAHLLGRTLVAWDLAAARQALAALQAPDVSQIVTLAGEMVHLDGVVSGGTDKQRTEGGLLARERELRDLPERIVTLDQNLHARQVELDDQRDRQETLLSQAADLARQAQDLAAEGAAKETRLAEERRAAERLEQEAAWLQARVAQATADLESLDAQETDLHAEADAAEERQQASDALLETLRRQIRALQDDEDLAAELATAQAALAVSEERIQQATQSAQAHRANGQQLTGRIAAREKQAAGLEDQVTALQAEIAQTEEARAALSQRIATLSTRIEPAEAQLRDLDTRRDALVEETSAARRDLLQLETDASRADLEVRRCRESIETLRHQVDVDLGEGALPEDDGLAAHQLWLRFEGADIGTMLPVTPALDMDALEQRISSLRRQIKAAGSVNPDAPAEYEEALSRYTFLSTQAEDLRDASRTLRDIITELDEVMQHEFDRTFKAVDQEFRRYFAQLFGGGTARLSLTDAEDAREAGVEIMARPPGKREQGLALLSGGERSLTAIALLFAILTVNPTPFCVLDEVDAALDEPNARRFRSALQDLAKGSQFIIITHNRVTMESSNTLYGVSMGEDSVSRVLSLKLDEVTDEALGVAGNG